MRHPADILQDMLSDYRTDPIRPLLLRAELQRAMAKQYASKPQAVIPKEKKYRITLEVTITDIQEL